MHYHSLNFIKIPFIVGLFFVCGSLFISATKSASALVCPRRGCCCADGSVSMIIGEASLVACCQAVCNRDQTSVTLDGVSRACPATRIREAALDCYCADGSPRPILSPELATCCQECNASAGATVRFRNTSQTCPGGTTGAASEQKTTQAPTPTGSPTTLYNPLGRGNVTIPNLVKRILSTVLGIVGAIALLMFIYGGIRWITSGGGEEGVKVAQTTLKNATIGLFLIFFSYIILTALLGAFSPGT